MTGIADLNFPAFHGAADAIRAAGVPAVNPADFGADPKLSWAGCLSRDLAVLVHCNLVVALPGHEQSRGARLELHVAKELGMPIFSLDELLALIAAKR